MHTDSTDREDPIHSPYESAVDQRVGSYRFHYDGRDRATPLGRTLRLARASHRYYFELVRAYDLNSHSPKVDRITRRQLQRAANALADLITSL